MGYVGIDWSDEALDFQMRSVEDQVVAEGQVKTNVEGMAERFTTLEAHGEPAAIAVLIETTHGVWIQPLLDRGYSVYPVKAKSAENFRRALCANGDKSDRIDRRVLAIMLKSLYRQLRPLQPEDPPIISLRLACQDRVRLVEERTAKVNELGAVLKGHYPAVLGLLNTEIRERDRQINECFQALPEAEWIRSLPGTGPVLGPALLACVGRDPQRFADVGKARALMGTAPVTEPSGKSRIVRFRWGGWKFARRTLQLFAEKSLASSRWAHDFYHPQRDKGRQHHRVLRELAHKWLKIILAMPRTGQPYDERIFTNSRERHRVNSTSTPALSPSFFNEALT